MNRLRLALLASALALAGCASMAPPDTRPPLPVAERFPDPGSGAAGSARAVDLAWQSFYADARLQRLIALAFEHNRDLRVAALNVEQLGAQLRLQRADRLPTVNAVAAGQRTPNSSGEMTSTYTAGLAITAFELDLFGRVRSLTDAALARWLASDEARRSVQIALAAQVAATYFALLADEELIALTRQALATREESLALTQLRLDYGVASELDLRQAQSLVEGARADLALLQRRRAQDRNALEVLVGQPLPDGLPPAGALDFSALGAEPASGLPSELLTERPDIRQAERTLAAANANIGAARAVFFPRISLTTSAGVASSELSELFTDGRFAWSLAPQLLLPIFDAGRNQANLDSAQAARAIALAQYEKAIQTAFREVADALAGRTTWADQLRALQAQTQAEAARVRLADLRYRNGASSFLELLDAQRSLLIVQQAAVQVRLAMLQNQVGLYKALGGGAPAADAAAR